MQADQHIHHEAPTAASFVSQVARLWRAARFAALEGVASERPAPAEEGAVVARLEPAVHDALLRQVFDRSRRAGLELVHRMGGTQSLRWITTAVEAASIPCFQGRWEDTGDGAARILRRDGCGEAACAQQCDYWREAVDGLVMGLGDDARYARHASRGNRDSSCVDVWYLGSHRQYRMSPVPEEVRAALEPLRHSLSNSGVTLTLLGLAERVLYYRLESSGGPACGAGGVLLRGVVEREVAAKLPGMRVLENTPTGVLRDGS